MSRKNQPESQPFFQNAFLDDLKVAFERRRKAIRSRLGRGGELLIERSTGDGDQLAIVGTPYQEPMIALIVGAGVANLEIRKQTRKAEGKVVLRLAGLRLTRNPSRIVGAFEETVNGLGIVSLEQIRKIWTGLELVSV